MPQTYLAIFLAVLAGTSFGQAQVSLRASDSGKKSAETITLHKNQITVSLDTSISAAILTLVEETKKIRELQKPEQYDRRSPYPLKRFWYSFGIDDWTITALTLFIFIVVWRQLLWMRKTVKVMGDTITVMKDTEANSRVATHQELRAYVHVEHPTVIKSGAAMQYLLSIKNFGSTPAKDVFIGAKVVPAEDGKDSRPDPDSLNVSPRAPIGPSQSVPWETRFSHDDLEGRRGGYTKLFLCGKVTYKDVFTEEMRVTTFMFETKGPWGDNPKLYAVEDGNKAT